MPTSAKIHRPSVKPQQRRESASKRGYGRHHQKLRAIELAENPLCLDCREKGIITAATEIDHVDGDSFNNEPSNRRPLCKPCHSKKTARENRGR
jgi:5-methylcytosine-specific restriction endonuclease McrA